MKGWVEVERFQELRKKCRRMYGIAGTFMKKNPVQCKDCGYLSLVHIDLPSQFPVNPRFFASKEVELPRRQAEFWRPTYWPIRCHVGKADLDEELRTWGDGIVQDNPIPRETELEDLGKWQEIITRDRECDGFIPYMQGMSPDEHKADERRQLEKRRDRRHELWVIALTTLVTASLLTIGEVLVKVLFN